LYLKDNRNNSMHAVVGLNALIVDRQKTLNDVKANVACLKAIVVIVHQLTYSHKWSCHGPNCTRSGDHQ